MFSPQHDAFEFVRDLNLCVRLQKQYEYHKNCMCTQGIMLHCVAATCHCVVLQGLVGLCVPALTVSKYRGI